MGPRPYSENSALPDSSNNERLAAISTQVSMETPTPSTASSATTPSPTPQEIIPVEQHVDAVVMQEAGWGDGMIPCYPAPGDLMPYDHSLPDFIRQITNQSNLANLQSLSLRVISTCISLHRVSAYLPNLKELDLEGSILNSLRDIGCSFRNLQILKVGRCRLESLDGTFGLSTLRELYAEKNLINDVSPCSNLPHIKHIDVSWNRIRNISYAGFLSVCNKLKSIAFTGNPATEVADYRKHVRRILPQIETLDGVPFSNDEAEEHQETEFIENFENESNSSADIPDSYSISPSDSMNNLLESEEDVNFTETGKSTRAKNAADQEQFEAEDQDSIPGPSRKRDIQDEFMNLSLQKKKGVLVRPKATTFSESRNTNIQQRSTSIQKLDKNFENKAKKSNFLLQSNEDEYCLSLPEIVPCSGSLDSSSKSSMTLLKATEGIKAYLKAEVEESSKQQEQSEKRRYQSTPVDENSKSFDQTKTEAIKKKPSTTGLTLSCPSCSSVPEISEKINPVNTLGTSLLTSGLPIRGNLTAALRNRSKQQELLKATLENFTAKETSTSGSDLTHLKTSAEKHCNSQNESDDSAENFT